MVGVSVRAGASSQPAPAGQLTRPICVCVSLGGCAVHAGRGVSGLSGRPGRADRQFKPACMHACMQACMLAGAQCTHEGPADCWLHSSVRCRALMNRQGAAGWRTSPCSHCTHPSSLCLHACLLPIHACVTPRRSACTCSPSACLCARAGGERKRGACSKQACTSRPQRCLSCHFAHARQPTSSPSPHSRVYTTHTCASIEDSPPASQYNARTHARAQSLSSSSTAGPDGLVACWASC